MGPLADMDDEYSGENLIFIISQPRSGSTLIQRVLSGHPEIFSSAETWLMLHQVYGLKRDGIHTEYEAEWALTAVEEFIEHYTDGPAVYDQGIRAFAQVLYGNALKRAGKCYFLDKTPRYYYIAKDLQRIFPKAHFVFLLRNPMAVLASELDTYVKHNLRFLSSFHDDLLLAPGLIMDAVDQFGSKAITLCYESFVKDPQEELERLCAQIGLPFRSEMLNYSDTPAAKGVMSDPVGIHRHTRPSTQSIDRWKEMAYNPQHRHFAQSYLHALGPTTIARMGYSYDQIKEVLAVSVPGFSDTGVFPWSIAIKPSSQWSMKERMQVRHQAAITKRGPVLGTIASLGVNASWIGRRIIGAFGSKPDKK